MKFILSIFSFILFSFNIDGVMTQHPCVLHISKEYQFIYFVVPKTGYTTIVNMLEMNQIDLEKKSQYIDITQWSGYFTFAFVRNPWDRVVSAYQNLVVSKRYEPFKHLQDHNFEYFIDYINSLDLYTCDFHLRLQMTLVPPEIEFIGRFENFKKDFAKIMAKIGLEGKEILHLNHSDHRHYSYYYNDRTREIIAEKYQLDIETYDYQFEEDPSLLYLKN